MDMDRLRIDDKSLTLLKFSVLLVVRSIVLCESFFHSVEFIKNTIGLNEMVAVNGAVFVSIFFATACTMPLRHVMIEIQKMTPDAEGNYPYTGYVDCAVKTFNAGGLFKFYTGFHLYYARISPACVLTCIHLESLRLHWERTKYTR